ncbi:MAG: peptidylprolyl isomerase [Nitrospinaceae bacterium]
MILALGAFGLAPVAADTGPDASFQINGKSVPQIVATVNGIDVPSQFLENQVVTYRLMAHQQGRRLEPREEQEFARETLNKLVDQELIYQKRQDLGISADSQKITQEIERISSQFPSQELFKRALAAQRLNFDMLRRSIERKILEDEFIRNEIAPKVKVEEDAVQAYYRENAKRFTKPERYKLQHIFVASLKPQDSGGDMDPELREKARRLNKLIEQDARDKVEMIHAKLKKGAKFEDLVKQYSEDFNSKDKAGLLGEVIPDTVFPEMAEVLPTLKEGGFSEPVRTPLGFHILKLAAKLPEATIPLEQVKTDILNFLLKEKVNAAYAAYLKDLRKTADIQLHL